MQINIELKPVTDEITRGRMLIFAAGDFHIGKRAKWHGAPCLVDDAGYVIHGAKLCAELPDFSDQTAAGSSEVNSISGNTSL